MNRDKTACIRRTVTDRDDDAQPIPIRTPLSHWEQTRTAIVGEEGMYMLRRCAPPAPTYCDPTQPDSPIRNVHVTDPWFNSPPRPAATQLDLYDWSDMSGCTPSPRKPKSPGITVQLTLPTGQTDSPKEVGDELRTDPSGNSDRRSTLRHYVRVVRPKHILK